MSDAERLPIRDEIERYALDCLSNPETQVKQLFELLRKSGDKILVTSQVVDRVGEMMQEKDAYVRTLAMNVYVELLKRNPELATNKRVDRFLELADDTNPKVSEMFLKKLRTPIEGFKNLDTQIKIKVFERLCDPDFGVEKEARETLKYIFGISPEVSKALADELRRFHPTAQRREAFRLLEDLGEELGRSRLDANAVFDEVRKLTKQTGQHEFADFKMMVRIAGNLLSGNGNVGSYNDCLEASFGLYREINKRIDETKSEMRKGDAAWNRLMEKLFKTWVPELAETMGYDHLTMGLRDVTEKAKTEHPDEFSIFEILKRGKMA
jgi:hypothetical protein